MVLGLRQSVALVLALGLFWLSIRFLICGSSAYCSVNGVFGLSAQTVSITSPVIGDAWAGPNDGVLDGNKIFVSGVGVSPPPPPPPPRESH